MVPDEPRPNPAPPNPETPPPPAAPPGDPAAPPANRARGSTLMLWGAAVAAAVIAGGAGWALSEPYVAREKPSDEASGQAYDFTALNAELRVIFPRNAAYTFGIFGGVMGLCFGLAGGLARPSLSPLHAAVAGLLGGALGAAAGALPPFGIMPLHFEYFRDPNMETRPTFMLLVALVHTGLLGLMGAVAGTALAGGFAGPRPSALAKGLVAGFFGTVIGIVAFQAFAAVLFADLPVTDPIPEPTDVTLVERTSVPRLVYRLCVSLGTALLVVMALSDSSPRRSAKGRPVEAA